MERIDSPYRARLKTFTIHKVAESAPALNGPITTPAAAVEYLRPFFLQSDAGREHFAVLYLGGKHHAIAAKVLFSGSTSEAAVYPKEIARTALLLGASAIICCHNHPSGDVKESPEDICLTRRINEGLRLLDIRLLDSIVIDTTSGRFKSIGVAGGFSNGSAT